MNVLQNKKTSGGVIAMWLVLSALIVTLFTGSVLHTALITFAYFAFEMINEHRVRKNKRPYSRAVLYILFAIALQLLMSPFGILCTVLCLFANRFIVKHIQNEEGKLDKMGTLDIVVPVATVLIIEMLCHSNALWLWNMCITPFGAAIAQHLCLFLELAFVVCIWLFLRTFCRTLISCVSIFFGLMIALALAIGFFLQVSLLFLILGVLVLSALLIAVIVLIRGVVIIPVAVNTRFNRGLLCFVGMFICVGFILTVGALLATGAQATVGSFMSFIYSIIH